MKTSKIIYSILLCLFFISCSSDKEYYEVKVNSNHQLGKVSGEGIYRMYKDCTVTAYSENNEEVVFSGWYNNNKIVSYVPGYTFEVLNDNVLEARFTTPDKIQDFEGQIAWQGVRDARVITYTFSYPFSINAGENITIDYTQNLSVTNSITCKSTIGNINIDTANRQFYFSSEEKGVAIITLSGNTSLMWLYNE